MEECGAYPQPHGSQAKSVHLQIPWFPLRAGTTSVEEEEGCGVDRRLGI